MKKNKDTAGNFIEPVETKQNVKPEKKVKAKKGAGFFSKLGKKIKDVFSELKKVNWPSFKNACKQTGTVLAVVSIFMLAVLGIDTLVAWILSLITKI